MTSYKSVLNSFIEHGKNLAVIAGQRFSPSTGETTQGSMKSIDNSSIKQKNSSNLWACKNHQLEHETDEAKRRATALEKRDAARRLRRH